MEREEKRRGEERRREEKRREEKRRDKTKRDAGFCRARSRLLCFAARGGGRQRRRRRRGRRVASRPRREVHSSSGRRQGDGVACKWWDERLMRFVSPTWKPDTYRPCFHFTARETYEIRCFEPRIGVRRQTHDKYRNRVRQLRAEKSICQFERTAIVRD